VDYRNVRRLKWSALRQAFARFLKAEWQTSSARDLAFRSFRFRERWWLDDYGLFRALHDENQSRYWREWEPSVRDRDPAALEASRERLYALILYYEYLQWVADDQWQRARRACGHVGVFGDFPFMVSGHSADVWARQHEFRHDASVGVPPDAFSETGQDWGLPVYRWAVMAERGHEWLRQRTRRCAELYDGFRLDHLVGFYRTFVRERDGSTAFIPPDEPSQREQGEQLLSMFSSSGARIIAEDLGSVPDFVRQSMARLRVPGLKVLRWERDWHANGQPFRDPAEYPSDSVATTGTHDTEPLAEWWDTAGPDERRAVAVLTRSQETDCADDSPFSDRLRDALLQSIYSAGSDVVLMPLQDIFGWRDRVNTPAVTSEGNWSWRLPWPVEDLLLEPEAVERARTLADLGRRYARGKPV
jgi:4-alpha-glucanotransferase